MGTVSYAIATAGGKSRFTFRAWRNVVVLNGPDGKIVVDTFLMPAWPKLKETLNGLGNAPLKTVIDSIGMSTTPANSVPDSNFPQASFSAYEPIELRLIGSAYPDNRHRTRQRHGEQPCEYHDAKRLGPDEPTNRHF